MSPDQPEMLAAAALFFHGQHSEFQIDAASETSRRAIGPNHPVAGNDHGKGISGHGVPDETGGGGSADTDSDIPVGSHLTIGNSGYYPVYLDLQIGHAREVHQVPEGCRVFRGVSGKKILQKYAHTTCLGGAIHFRNHDGIVGK